MKKIQYELTPEAYGPTGIFIDKTGIIGKLIFDTGMILRFPFDIDMVEYNEIVDYLINLPLNRLFRVDKREFI